MSVPAAAAAAAALVPLSRAGVLSSTQQTGLLLPTLWPIVVDYLRFDYAWSLEHVTQLSDFLYLTPSLFSDWRSVHATHARCLCSPYRSLVTRENEALLGVSALSQAKYCLDHAGDVFVMNPLFLHQYQHPDVIERLHGGDVKSATGEDATSTPACDSRPSTPTIPAVPVGPRPHVVVKLNAEPDLSLALADVECSRYGSTAFRIHVHSYLECVWLGVMSASRATAMAQLRSTHPMSHRMEMSRMRDSMSTESGVCLYASDKLDPSVAHAELVTLSETSVMNKPVTVIQNGDIIDVVVDMPEYEQLHPQSRPSSPSPSRSTSTSTSTSTVHREQQAQAQAQAESPLTDPSPSTGTVTFYRNRILQGTCWIPSHETWIPACLLDCQGDTVEIQFAR